MATIEVRLDPAALSRLLAARGGPVLSAITRGAVKVETRAKQLLTIDDRIKSGDLKRTIGVRLVLSDPSRLEARVGSPLPQARWVHEGTGIYGPKGTPIVPRRAKVLRFPPSGAPGGRVAKDGFIYARSVKGIRPTPFLTDALASLRASDLGL